MAQQTVAEIVITPSQYQEVSQNGTTDITVQINYYDDEEAGYESKAVGQGNIELTLCGKPCDKGINLPPPNQG